MKKGKEEKNLIKVKFEIIVKQVNGLPKELNRRSLVVEWRRGTKKINRGETRSAQIADGLAIWLGSERETFTFQSKLVHYTKLNKFEQKDLRLALKNGFGKKADVLYKVEVNLGEMATNGYNLCRDVKFPSKLKSVPGPVLSLQVKAEWLKINNKKLVKKSGSEIKYVIRGNAMEALGLTTGGSAIVNSSNGVTHNNNNTNNNNPYIVLNNNNNNSNTNIGGGDRNPLSRAVSARERAALSPPVPAFGSASLRTRGVTVIPKSASSSVIPNSNFIQSNNNNNNSKNNNSNSNVDPLEFLEHRLDDVAVFYGVSPEHKMRIVEAYKRKGHVVAMTGDGVNDAPALKIADIGIAMGRTGTDVSKEAAEMILVDDNFATIVAAIEEGKSIYNNIKNFLRYQLTTSIATLSIVASSTVFGLPLPLTPIQILWINIIMDGPPAQSLGVEPLDRDVMKRPPRDSRKPVFNSIMVLSIVVSAMIMLVGTLATFYATLNADDNNGNENDTDTEGSSSSGGSNTRAVTMCFTTFVFFQMFNALNCRSEDKSVFRLGFTRNNFFLMAVGGSTLLQLAAVYVPLLQTLFDTESLALEDLLVCVGVASTVLVWDELRKRVLNNNNSLNGLLGSGGGDFFAAMRQSAQRQIHL